MAPDAAASDDISVQSKSKNKSVSEANDDCFSRASRTDEHANQKSSTEDSRVKNNTENNISGESSKGRPSSLQAELYIQNSILVNSAISKTINTADSVKAQNTSLQGSNQKLMDVNNDTPCKAKNELEGSTEDLVPSPTGGVTCADPPQTVLNSNEKNDGMELEVPPVNESDDSDMVEQDVKVCDICGDAGREDLLAICYRCSDGAEHTYCMREMLSKVPEGEWLCEECKNVERASTGRREKAGRIDENEKNNSSGLASSEHPHSSDAEGHNTKGYMKISCKRPRDEADGEVSSKAKKPALDSIVGSPKNSNSSKPAASLSRESSSKNLVKGRLQASHLSSSGAVQVNDATEPAISASDLRAHNFRGTFSKSNSFNSLNSKPKVKLVDQAVIRRQKSAKEYSSFRSKESVGRPMGKSMSFKSTNANQTETKMKMMSPRLSESTQDTKTMKQKTPFEHQRLSRAENSSMTFMKGTSLSPSSRNDKRSLSRTESSVPTIASNHEMKPAQGEGKSALSRSFSLAGRRTSDISSSLGEAKRPLPSSHATSANNGVNNIEKRLNQASLKEEVSSSVSAERPPFVGNESSGRGINLKAAIEAAVLKKPGVYRKNRTLGQPDDSSASVLAGKKRLCTDTNLPDKPAESRGINADSLAEEIPNNVKHSTIISGEGALRSGGQEGISGLSSGGMNRNVSAAVPLLLKSVPVPEHEYIWQGCFEIYRGSKLFDLWEGIQAHVSTCASPKVIEAANKLKDRIVLYEVPRLSTWPIHFKEHGATEDSVALFFFARDVESYDKIFKVLLDNMMKNDLALKGSINDFELLIFPSNKLPHKSQRWNMLFFLWGVFRGKKANCLQHMPESLKQIGAPQDIPPPVMSLPDNRCSQRPITEELPATGDVVQVIRSPTSETLPNALPSRPVNGDLVAKLSILGQVNSSVNSSSPAATLSGTENNCKEMKSLCQVGGDNPSSSASPATKSSGREQMLMQLDNPLDRVQTSPCSMEVAAGNVGGNIVVGPMLDVITAGNQVNTLVDSGGPLRDGKLPLKNERFNGDLNMEPDRWSFNHKEGMPSEQYVGPQTSFTAIGPLEMRSHGSSGAHEKMNPLASANLHEEAHVNTLVSECNDNAERRFFPIESQPEKGGHLADSSIPWKLQLPEQDQLSDRAPNLELALGGEKCVRGLDIQPLLVDKVHPKVNEEHILKETVPKAEDDVSATLSLSLSFPFPEKELSAEAAPKTSRRMGEREHMSSSMLLFGDLGDS
ncbi:uncharacterized protein LOC127252732 [Andrographis paniculata]|uniref:uncharacterized protein LOC127252732 n=1 Tax=Andrographis paniculata TaxID=175694 RepID=UPI0021E985F0|nr:uncharacterized protein LOC127252732 [Andrographis paniculata]